MLPLNFEQAHLYLKGTRRAFHVPDLCITSWSWWCTEKIFHDSSLDLAHKLLAFRAPRNVNWPESSCRECFPKFLAKGAVEQARAVSVRNEIRCSNGELPPLANLFELNFSLVLQRLLPLLFHCISCCASSRWGFGALGKWIRCLRGFSSYYVHVNREAAWVLLSLNARDEPSEQTVSGPKFRKLKYVSPHTNVSVTFSFLDAATLFFERLSAIVSGEFLFR